jgi:hypothetical protein
MTAEKTQQTVQTTVLSLPDTWIVFLGRPLRGHHHDAPMLQHAWPPEVDGLTALSVRVDRGSRGMKADSRGEQMDLPTQKPRKSQQNPNPPVSDEHRTAKTALRHVRIVIAHAMGGMKRSNILVHAFRNRIEHFEDDVIGVCAGLWNLVLSY